MNLHQYAIYQLKESIETKPYRFRSYQYMQEHYYKITVANYNQVYISFAQPDDNVETIRDWLQNALPRRFTGHAIGISDVILYNKEGITTAYYIDKTELIEIPGFLKLNYHGDAVSMDTTGYRISGVNGTWTAIDEKIVDGRQYYLFQNEQHGTDVAYTILDSAGTLIMESCYDGFDNKAIEVIRASLTPKSEEKETPKQELWQKSYENGEYVRSQESGTEQNYDMVDGRVNNQPIRKSQPQKKKPQKQPKRKRESVLKRLKQIQLEIAVRDGKITPEQAVEMERKLH